MYQTLTTKNYPTSEKTHLAQLVIPSEGISTSSFKPSAMTLVIKHLLVAPHTCASLVQKIGTYSASHISHCLTKLKKAGFIGAEWHDRKVCLVYYNIKLDQADSKVVARKSKLHSRNKQQTTNNK
ncbi:MAG TPA: hypothetical protein DCE56_17970 [Cyanobacteria bacterium UBA8553]|nr:hypothetical protein [Cyanobacteria bacterium UBA8553]HAJ64517.1 hypothetical protein [Cyanobacteria bacterium UBA8543]